MHNGTFFFCLDFVFVLTIILSKIVATFQYDKNYRESVRLNTIINIYTNINYRHPSAISIRCKVVPKIYLPRCVFYF